MKMKDLKNLIRMGEGPFLEFKQYVPSPEKIAREICAFANTSGGTILVGVDDKGQILGVENYMEEQFYLEQAASDLCKPEVPLQFQVFPVKQRDVLIVRIEEAEHKPIVVVEKEKRRAYLREDHESVLATKEQYFILKRKHSSRGVSFNFGADEQALFRYLNEYNRISVEEFSNLINTSKTQASKILTSLASIDILSYATERGKGFFSLLSKES